MPPPGTLTASLVVPDALWCAADDELGAVGLLGLTSTQTILAALAQVPCVRVLLYTVHSTADGMRFSALLKPGDDSMPAAEAVTVLRQLGFTAHVVLAVEEDAEARR